MTDIKPKASEIVPLRDIKPVEFIHPSKRAVEWCNLIHCALSVLLQKNMHNASKIQANGGNWADCGDLNYTFDKLVELCEREGCENEVVEVINALKKTK